ncbi:hypothetical protein [Flavobacterium chungbukense]|nr:hypothetical protein [Flavobacterium chungbukense]
MDEEYFGSCSDAHASEIECLQGISVLSIAKMNLEYLKALAFRK